MYTYLLVFVGAGIGGAARHAFNQLGVDQLGARVWGVQFPWSTLVVNVIGSLLMGLLIAFLAQRTGTSQHARLFLATGILGGFTTFSAFSLEVVALHERGESVVAIGYIAASVLLATVAVFLGLWLGRQVSS